MGIDYLSNKKCKHRIGQHIIIQKEGLYLVCHTIAKL